MPVHIIRSCVCLGARLYGRMRDTLQLSRPGKIKHNNVSRDYTLRPVTNHYLAVARSAI